MSLISLSAYPKTLSDQVSLYTLGKIIPPLSFMENMSHTLHNGIIHNTFTSTSVKILHVYYP